jgi:hypothetical protein
MKRIFKVELSKSLYPLDTYRYEVVADTAEQAIKKARIQARRESAWRGAWVVDLVQHRGAAV